MSKRSPWLRPLAALALLLGIVDVALLVTWWRREPALPIAAGAEVAQLPAAPPPAVTDASAARDSIPADTAAAPAPSATPTVSSALLYGTITRSDGTAVANAVLWLYRDGEHVGTTRPTDSVYAFAGLRPGDYRIDSRIDDALPLHRTVHVAAPRTRSDLALDPCRVLKVHAITPDGQPLSDAVGKLDPRLGGLRSLAAAAFAAPMVGDLPLSEHADVEAGVGTFRSNDAYFGRGAAMEKKTVGVLTLPSGAAVTVALLLRSAVLAQQQTNADQTEITFTIDPAQLVQRTATVHLRIVDDQGTPVAGARVALNDAQTGGGGKQTGDDGRIVLEHIVPGRLRLQVMHKDSVGQPLLVDVSPGADLDLGDITVRHGVDVAFTGDFGGTGAVRLTWLDAPPQPGRTVNDLYLSAQNGATIRGSLFPGRYAAIATSERKGALFELDTSALPPMPIRIDLQPGAPLRLRGGRDGETTGVDVQAANGAWFRRSRWRGEFDFTEVLPIGSYTIAVTDPGGASTQQVAVLSRDGATLDLR